MKQMRNLHLALAATLFMGIMNAGCEEAKTSLLVTMAFHASVSPEIKAEVRTVGTILRMIISGAEEWAGEAKLEEPPVDPEVMTMRYRPLVTAGHVEFHLVLYRGGNEPVPLLFGRGGGDIQTGVEDAPVAVTLFPCTGNEADCPAKMPDKKCARDDECTEGFSCDVGSGRCLKKDQPDLATTLPQLDMSSPQDMVQAPDLVPPLTCGDKIKNGQETDVDCGGPCPPCSKPGLGCQMPADCEPKIGLTCEGGKCRHKLVLVDPGPTGNLTCRWVKYEGFAGIGDFQVQDNTPVAGPPEAWGVLCFTGRDVRPELVQGTSCGPVPGGSVFREDTNQVIGLGGNATCTQKP